MAQVNMPSRAPTQLDALAAALDIGKSLYGISTQREQMELEQEAEKRRIAQFQQEEEARGLNISALKRQAEEADKLRQKNERLASGKLDSMIEATKFASENKLSFSKEPTQIKFNVQGQDIYFKPQSDLEQQKALLDIEGKKLDIQGKIADRPKRDLEYQLKQQDLINTRKQGEKLDQEINKLAKDSLKGKYDQNQTLSAGFTVRMENAENNLNNLFKNGFNPSLPKNSLQDLGIFPEIAKTEVYKSYEQAKRSFINAQLRRESGATITDKEFINAEKQYFPQIGDSQEVIQQKAIERQNAIDAMKFASSGAYDDLIKTQIPTSMIVKQKSLSPISEAQANDRKVPLFNPNKKFNEVK